MKIKDFFNIVPSTSTKNTSQSSQKGYNDVVIKKRSPQTSGNQTNQMLTVNLHVEKPDIILLEDMDDINSNCILLNVCTINLISIYLVL